MMDSKDSHYLINKELSLMMPTGKPLTAQAADLMLRYEDNEVIQCRLKFSVSFDRYQQIDKQALFNLRPDVRGPVFGGKFAAGQDVEIEAALNPDFLPDLLEDGETPGDIARYLLTLSEKQPNHPLVATENWYALYVKQAVTLPPELAEEGSEVKVGYATKWARETENAAEVDTDENDDISGDPLIDLMIDYFSEEDWPFSLVGDNVLKLYYRGRHAEWECYAKARPDYAEVGFYSLYPERIPEAKRGAILEYITRANYGLPTGNFEMDLDTGGLRFKTSIDFEGDRFSRALLDRLVKVNVFLMDKYAFGIKRVLHEAISPREAIREVEGQ